MGSACATGSVGSRVRTVALTRRWITARRCQREARSARWRRLLPGAPEVLREPIEAQVLQRLRQWLAGLAVVADFPVPGVDHLLPLRGDRLPHRGAVVRRGAVAVRRLFEIRPEPPAHRRPPLAAPRAPAHV